MRQKAAHQEFLTIPHFDTLPVVIKEMEEISVNVLKLDFKEVENVGEKNIENMIVAYPNAIQCSGDSNCLSRKGVAMSNYKGCMDTLSSYSTAMRAICIMRNPSIPFNVMTSNLDAGRPLDSAIGFTKSGYIPSSRRFQTKYEGVHNLWVSISKSSPDMMSKRFKRDSTEVMKSHWPVPMQ